MQKMIRFVLSAVAMVVYFLLPIVHAQLTVNVTTIPANTPAGANIYIVGTFNTWNPGDATKILTKQANNTYSITFNPPVGAVEYKFTRGNWATVEGNASGTQLPNRTLTYNGQPMTVNVTILTWEDLGGGNGSTAAPNVQILSSNFFMPQLNRSRRIWLYLPPDYQTTTKRYPVLYMHDGQNLFDSKTAFGGNEWKVDESLNTLHQQGDYGCIVVGIDNGGAERLNEYSPWPSVNPAYGGGQGDKYIKFIVETLKPHVDSAFRTLPGRLTTGIMGSSMGGIISMYGFSERQDVFSKAGIFSPAFWFAGDKSVNHVKTHPKQGAARVYFLAGGKEGDPDVIPDMQEVADGMTVAGFTASEKLVEISPDGQHSEWFWAREFADTYKWLFVGTVSSTEPQTVEDLKISPNPVTSGTVRFAGLQSGQQYDYQIIGTDGKLWRDSTLTGSERLKVNDLPRGIYVVRVRKTGTAHWHSGKMVKQ